tara:strand:+ start:461 stop:946 length:486 start_codon:yes stop_codon:yes gene_type:complete
VKQVASKTKTEVKLDEKDKLILKELQQDCKQTFKELAKKLKLPETTVKRRVKRLEKEGVIKGYHAVLDPRKAGKTVAAFFYIQGQRTPDYSIKEMGMKLTKMPCVQEVYAVVGEKDFLIKGYYTDLDEYFKLADDLVPYSKSGGGILVSKVFKETLALNLK